MFYQMKININVFAYLIMEDQKDTAKSQQVATIRHPK